MLGQIDSRVPALSNELDKVIVSVDIDLDKILDQITRKRSTIHITKWEYTIWGDYELDG